MNNETKIGNKKSTENKGRFVPSLSSDLSLGHKHQAWEDESFHRAILQWAMAKETSFLPRRPCEGLIAGGSGVPAVAQRLQCPLCSV